MKNISSIVMIAMLFSVSVFPQKNYTVVSPDGKLRTIVTVGKQVEYSVSHDGDQLLSNSPVSMTLGDGSRLGADARVSRINAKSVNSEIDAVNYKKNKVIDNYNELEIRFKGDYSLLFRAYNEGVAYRFITSRKSPFIVEQEQVVYNFPGNPNVYIPYVNDQNGQKDTFEKQFYNSFENLYEYTSIEDWNARRLAFLPLLVEGPNGKKICITEADLLNYPGLYLSNREGASSLTGVFAPYPKEITRGGHNDLQGEVQSREPFIAKCEGKTEFPWRIVIISENDYDLVNNDMVYRLASPNRVDDVSWIKPGKVAWDWWNDWNIYNVDFESGINNDTYKYYIDFASDKGVEYVILDEGWSVHGEANLLKVIPEIDLPTLVDYANSKNVGLILWAGYWALNRDIEGICRHYSEMGIKGFKVDFMDRDDQPMVEFHHKVAEVAAKYKLLIDYHGSYKPTGLQRTYPNVINFEGVHGLEQMKWATVDVDQVTYDVTMPFIRMVAGPIDYTQGAMRNASKHNYRPVYSEAMSQGTRCRQLAQYVIFESPLNMLCDSPSNYLAEPECTEFIANIPTTWDETVALNGKIGEYVSVARRKGSTWYVGSMTNWRDRSLEIDLSFLGEGNFTAEVFKDGSNAHRVGKDYKKAIVDIPTDRKIVVDMASGGGIAIKVTKK